MKYIVKKIILVGMIICGMCMFISCDNKMQEKDASLQKVLDAKKMILGLDENFPPMGFRNNEGEIVGFDIDLAKEVSKRLGVELVLEPIDWDKKEELLNNGSIDCIWNGMSITDQRKEKMTLSEPYMINEMVFVVSEDSGLKSVSNLKEKKIGTQEGSSTADVLKTLDMAQNNSIVYMEDNVKLLNSLEKGDLDSVFLDSVFAYYYISEYNKKFYMLPSSYNTEGFAVGFRKGDITLCEKIQEILSEMKKDLTLEKISVEWFNADITTVK